MNKSILISVMLLFVAALGFNLANASTDQPHVYINPGHGGHSSDDRNVPIYPYAQGDTMGFWESNSNMYKCLSHYCLHLYRNPQVCKVLYTFSFHLSATSRLGRWWEQSKYYLY